MASWPRWAATASIVEMDETYHGKSPPRARHAPAAAVQERAEGRPANKRAIVSLVERGGSVRSFHVENADKATVNVIVADNIARETRLHYR